MLPNTSAIRSPMLLNLYWSTSLCLGDYPPVMREYVDRKSQEQGYQQSRLPVFTPQEVDRIRGKETFKNFNRLAAKKTESTHNKPPPPLSLHFTWCSIATATFIHSIIHSCFSGTADFFGLNHYSTGLIGDQESQGEGWEQDQDISWTIDPSWPR